MIEDRFVEPVELDSSICYQSGFDDFVTENRDDDKYPYQKIEDNS